MHYLSCYALDLLSNGARVGASLKIGQNHESCRSKSVLTHEMRPKCGAMLPTLGLPIH